MRIFYLFIFFATFLYLPAVLGISTVSAAADCGIFATLRVGSKGSEVGCLQAKVGVPQDGSFGPLTKSAVMAFQTKNALKADGIVGPKTRLVFTSLATLGPSLNINNDKKPETPKEKPEDANSNLTNIDEFIDIVIETNKKSGLDEKQLKLIEDALRKEVINSQINYKDEFEKLLTKELAANSDNRSPLGFLDKITSKALSFLGIKPPLAEAQLGAPFGGALVFPFFCGASGNWMIGLTPLPPTFAGLLSYYPGTQGFASYNTPATRFLLGMYTPPGVCVLPTFPIPIPIPTQGTITPMLGSSPI